MKLSRSSLFSYINGYKKQLLLLFAALLLLFFFFSEVKAVVVAAILAFLGAFGQVYKRVLRVPSAVEFVTFGTVVVAVSYGPVAGALFALSVSFAAEIISGGIDAFVLVYWPVRILSGVFAALVPFESIFAVGLATTAFINLLSQPIYLLQGDVEVRMKGIVYLVVNIAFNAILFRTVGELAVSLA